MSQSAAQPTMHVMGGPKTDNERLATQIASILEKRGGFGLQQQWDMADHATIAKDAAKIAVQAATSSKSDRKMISSEVSEQRGSLDATNFAVKSLERKITGMQEHQASLRNTCLMFGLGASIVGAFFGSMAFAPYSGPTATTAPQIRSVVVAK